MLLFSFEQLIQLIIFILPAYVANSAPVFFGRSYARIPIDFKAKFIDKRRLLGGGKTWPGFFVGILAGLIAATITSQLITIYPSKRTHIFVGLMLAIGAMLGDTLGSFVKRRLNITHGRPAFLLDQIPFLLVALAFAYPWKPDVLDTTGFIFLLALTVVLHSGTNIIAHRLGLKKVPW